MPPQSTRKSLFIRILYNTSDEDMLKIMFQTECENISAIYWNRISGGCNCMRNIDTWKEFQILR